MWHLLVAAGVYCVQRWGQAGQGLYRARQTGASQVEDLEELAVGKFIPLHADTDPHAQGS